MRNFDETGKLVHVSDRANEAYRLYASLYLDYVDDNINHFKWRDIDIRPIEGINILDANGDINSEIVFNAYMNASVDITKHTLEGSKLSIEAFFKEYPLLKEREGELKKYLAQKGRKE